METIAATGLVRVVIVAPSRRLSVALPVRVTLATLLPDILRRAVGSDPSWPTGGWVLRRIDGSALDPARTLAAQGVLDGEVLHLMPQEIDWPETTYDDVVEAIAATSRAQGTAWRPEATRWAGLGAAVVTLLVALVVIVQAGPPWMAPAFLALAIGGFLIVAGTLFARAGGSAVTGKVLAVTGLPYVFTGSLFVLADEQTTVTGVGAPHMLVAGLATVVAALAAGLGVGELTGVLLAGAVAGGAAAVGGAVGLTALDGGQAAGVVLALLVLAHPLLGLLALRFGRVPVPAVPLTPADLERDDAQPSLASVAAATRRGNRILFGLVLGVSVASTVCIVVTAMAGGIAAPLLAAVASLVLLLRARNWRTIQLRAPMLVAGALGVVLCVLAAVPDVSGTALLVATVGVLVAAAAVLVAIGLTFAGRTPSPRLSRLADVVDVLAVISVVPVAVGVVGLYDAIMGIQL
jgi:type VII secretion integral membrane protein EccD